MSSNAETSHALASTKMLFNAGAFTPGCSKTHLPGYVADYEKLTKAGAEVIACVTVNDAFVTAAWGEANGADGKVRWNSATCDRLSRRICHHKVLCRNHVLPLIL